MDFNDIEEICREELDYLVELSREFVKHAQDMPRQTESQQFAQYNQQLSQVSQLATGLDDTATQQLVARFWDQMQGEGEGEKYVTEMEKLREKFDREELKKQQRMGRG